MNAYRSLGDAEMKSEPAKSPCLMTKCAAKYLVLSPRTLEDLRASGKGPRYFKLGPGRGARVVYRLQDLDAWLARFAYTSTSEYGS
jgi:hypothetical protein